MSLKKLFFLSTVIFLIGQMDLFAQSEKVSLSGTIQDAKSGETLPFVVVNIKDLNLWTTSDINGKFSFKNVKKGTNPSTKRSHRDRNIRKQAKQFFLY